MIDIMTREEFRMLTYEEALKLVNPHINNLIQSRKLKAFCKENDLNYNVVVIMFSDKDKRMFPDTLQELLIIFGFNSEREKAFKIFD